MANAVAKAKSAELSTDVLDDIFETAGDGASFAADEMQIPFVRILQALSPQLNKKKPEFIEGASSSDMYNTVTGQYWDGEEGVVVVPCYQTTKYLEFVPRDQGGGFKGEIPANDPMLQRTSREGSKEILPHGNELVKSDQHYCLVLDADGGFQPAVIDMKSSQLKVSRRWKTQIAMQKIKHPRLVRWLHPRYTLRCGVYLRLKSPMTKVHGATTRVAKESLVTDRDLLMEAKAFRESIMAGEVKAAKDPEHASPAQDDDIPF